MCEKIAIPLTIPFNAVLVAETGGGKTTLITKILSDKKRYLTKSPAGLCILYSSYQPVYESWKQHFDMSITHYGIPGDFTTLLPRLENGWLLVCDDLQKQTCTSDEYLRIMTSGRHANIQCTFTVWHTAFPSCKNSRILAQNFHVYFLLRSARLAHQVSTLGTQLGYGSSNLKNVYKRATVKPYSYLLVDQSDRTATDRRLTLRSNCTDETGPVVCYGWPGL